LSVDSYLHEGEDSHGYTLADIEDREGLRVVLKLKTEDLLSMCVHCAILEAPQETHYKDQVVELVNNSESNSSTTHYQNDYDVHKRRFIAAVPVNDPANKKASEYLSSTEKNHCVVCIGQLLLLVMTLMCSYHHFN
jgi:hypothetical protein